MYTLVTKGGRARTGSDSKGQIIHAVMGKPQNGFWSSPPLCGQRLKLKGFGWLEMPSDYQVSATCKTCLNLIKFIKNKENAKS